MSKGTNKKEKCELEILIEKLRHRKALFTKRDERLTVTGQLKEGLGHAEEAHANAS